MFHMYQISFLWISTKNIEFLEFLFYFFDENKWEMVNLSCNVELGTICMYGGYLIPCEVWTMMKEVHKKIKKN